jgi:hypothetical protein
VLLAVVLGGVSLRGGRGKVWGVIIGAFLVASSFNMIDLLGIYSDFPESVFWGILIGLLIAAHFRFGHPGEKQDTPVDELSSAARMTRVALFALAGLGIWLFIRQTLLYPEALFAYLPEGILIPAFFIVLAAMNQQRAFAPELTTLAAITYGGFLPSRVYGFTPQSFISPSLWIYVALVFLLIFAEKRATAAPPRR